jgi:hypothetical protein
MVNEVSSKCKVDISTNSLKIKLSRLKTKESSSRIIFQDIYIYIYIYEKYELSFCKVYQYFIFMAQTLKSNSK